MKKKKGSVGLLSVFGGAIIGLLGAALSDVIVFAIPFEREWVTYASLVVLLLMAIRITSLWIQSSKQESPSIDIDEVTLKREELAYKFVGTTSLFLIIACASLLFILVEGFSQVIEIDEVTSSAITSFIIITILFFYGFFAQLKAGNFHNKHNPDSMIDMKRSDGYTKYFEGLDEGEKFEAYRVSHKSFYQMNFIFPLALMVLFLVSIVFSPQLFAITIVGALWFIMYMIYYREGYKVYKQ